jgi:hypothetical protein
MERERLANRKRETNNGETNKERERETNNGETNKDRERERERERE